MCRKGSPPLTRGKAHLNRRHNAIGGITPAYAGKSTSPTTPAISRSRITPAYAGKSQAHHQYAPIAWDHPRLRGEKRNKAVSRKLGQGSPPLTRGKVKELATSGIKVGITPAYAGKRFIPHIPGYIYEDHPRLRGEKVFLLPKRDNDRGSPPLTRGKVLRRFLANRRDRITPAYAGKSPPIGVWYNNLQDHPRLRGEKRSIASLHAPRKGSPPLTRGKAAGKELEV